MTGRRYEVRKEIEGREVRENDGCSSEIMEEKSRSTHMEKKERRKRKKKRMV